MTEQELMLTSILNCERVKLYADPVELSLKQRLELKEMQDRRRTNEPVQYILGECGFMGLILKVDKRVFIPRPETEILVDLVLEKAGKFRERCLNILDLGTGSGNIALSMAYYFKDCFVTAVEVSRDALFVANENANKHNLGHKVKFIQEDIFVFLKADSNCKNMYDVVVSNPPYIPSSLMVNLPYEVKKEPEIALDGGCDGLRFYYSIIPNATRLLKNGGLLVFEIGDGQRNGIENIFSECGGYSSVQFYGDHIGIDRVVVAMKI